eukprot:scaffold1843_cov87-Cylindrotheca_fusiformis.AAC.3
MKSKQVFVTLLEFLALLTLSSGSLIPSPGAEDKTSSTHVAGADSSMVAYSRPLLRRRAIQHTSSAIDGVDRRLDEEVGEAELQKSTRRYQAFHDSRIGRVVFYLALAFACPIICYCCLSYCISFQNDNDDANEDSKDDKSATTFDNKCSRSSSSEDLEDSSQNTPVNSSVDS